VVDSTQYQHTSVFATLRDVFGIGALTKRDAQAKSFASVLSLKMPRTDAPATLKRPAMPPPDPGHLAKPLTDRQADLWPILSHLDGHKDSGKVTTPPRTRAAAQKYIEERLAAHEQFHRMRRRKAVYQVTGRPGRYSWQLRGDDGVVLAKAPRTYPTRLAVEKVIGRLRDLAPHARQTDPKR